MGITGLRAVMNRLAAQKLDLGAEGIVTVLYSPADG